MKSIDEIEVLPPTPAFGISVYPQHPVLSVVGMGIDILDRPYIEVKGAASERKYFATPAQNNKEITRLLLSDVNHIVKAFWDFHGRDRQLTKEGLGILDFFTECANLMGEIGESPLPLAGKSHSSIPYASIPLYTPSSQG